MHGFPSINNNASSLLLCHPLDLCIPICFLSFCVWCGNGVSAFFGVIVNIFLETGIVLLLLLRSQVASSDRTHTDAIESERDGEGGRKTGTCSTSECSGSRNNKCVEVWH